MRSLPFLTLVLGLATPAFATPAFAGQTIDLKGGVATPIPGTALTVILSSVTDQRCPADVACVWEGLIKAEITVVTGTRARTTLTLCNACETAGTPQTVAGKTFVMGNLLPGRDVLDPLSRLTTLEDYTLQIAVLP